MSDEEIKLPSAEELDQLPLRAIVIFAARNARRVMPFYRLPDEVPREERVRHSRAVQSAVKLAERYGSGAAARTAEASWAAAAASDASSAAMDAAQDAAFRAYTLSFDTYAADAAAAAAYAAYAATAATDAADAAARGAYAAADSNAETAAYAGTVASFVETNFTRHRAGAAKARVSAYADFRTLLSLDPVALGKGIDLSESGPLGPLWPGGPPDWYLPALRKFGALVADEPILKQIAPSDSDSEDKEPVFIVAWDPALVSEDEYAELVGSLGDLVRAHGGLGVRRLQEDTYGVIGAGVPV